MKAMRKRICTQKKTAAPDYPGAAEAIFNGCFYRLKNRYDIAFSKSAVLRNIAVTSYESCDPFKYFACSKTSRRFDGRQHKPVIRHIARSYLKRILARQQRHRFALGNTEVE